MITLHLPHARLFAIALALAAASSAQVSHDAIAKGAANDWLTYAGTYAGWRYSPLTQITADNAKNVVPKWVYRVPQARGIERAIRKAGLIDCGMLTRVANDVAEPGALYGGMRLMKKPGELPHNS